MIVIYKTFFTIFSKCTIHPKLIFVKDVGIHITMFIIEYKTMVANTVYFEFLSFFIQTFICNTQLHFENYKIKQYLEEEKEVKTSKLE